MDHADDRDALVVHGDDGAEERDAVGEAEGAVDRVEDPLERGARVHGRELLAYDAMLRESPADQGAEYALGRQIRIGDVAGVRLEPLGEARLHVVSYDRP